MFSSWPLALLTRAVHSGVCAAAGADTRASAASAARASLVMGAPLRSSASLVLDRRPQLGDLLLRDLAFGDAGAQILVHLAAVRHAIDVVRMRRDVLAHRDGAGI